jgi:hypothetical protein
VLLVALAELVAIGHGAARHPAILADVEADRCERDDLDTPDICRAAALLARAATTAASPFTCSAGAIPPEPRRRRVDAERSSRGRSPVV